VVPTGERQRLNLERSEPSVGSDIGPPDVVTFTEIIVQWYNAASAERLRDGNYTMG
jgi:hypothetical protein